LSRLEAIAGRFFGGCPFRRHFETMLISAAARLRGTADLQVAIDHDEQSKRFV
jgi:hypothetical protein